jgi:hypothetical protein
VSTEHGRIARLDPSNAGGAPPGIGLRRRIGLGGLVFGTMASIIGSGWLFGPLYAAQYAARPRSWPGRSPVCCSR